MATPTGSEPLSDPTTVRFTKSAKKRWKRASAALHLSERATFILIFDTGLEQLERIQYNLPAAVVDRAQRPHK